MMPKMIRKHCVDSAEGEKLLGNAITRLGFSARAHQRILKAASPIADLDGAKRSEYRTLDRSYWSPSTALISGRQLIP
jgi:magnesium chelatase family protein